MELSFYQEYCEQGDLRNYVKHGVGSRHICYPILQDILDGLAYLHSHDPPITHGNLNPGKIFVTSNGRVKIGEFGLAASTVGFSHLVPAVSFNGLVRWMSPEQLQLEAASQGGPVPTKSDVWSLGCTMFEIITGQLPYSKYKHDAKFTQRIMKGEPPGSLERTKLLGEVDKDTPGGEAGAESRCANFLRDVIKRCWESAQDRASSRELLAQLIVRL
ncbi:hypothetical protein FRC08_011464 [Ceratobasidium sp. 394]|nr:hypothetical protein FRC08_011464 [Ceratobasidium sp. 394]